MTQWENGLTIFKHHYKIIIGDEDSQRKWKIMTQASACHCQ